MARLQLKAKRYTVQWIDGPDKTSSDDLGNEDLGAKSGNDSSVGKRWTPHQLDVDKLELEQQPHHKNENSEHRRRRRRIS